MDSLYDLMTNKQYVVFTKTPKLEYAKDLHKVDVLKGLTGLIGYSKKELSSLTPTEIKTAKYAHIVTLTTKNIIKVRGISDENALAMAQKIKHPSLTTLDAVEKARSSNMSLYVWLDILLKGRDVSKDLSTLKIDVADYYGNVLLFSPKAYKVEKTYLLEKKKTKTTNTSLSEEEKNILADYVPDLGDSTSFRIPMPPEKIKENASQMSDDDLAWHLLNSKNANALGDAEFMRNRLGFREICILILMNKNITKKERTEIAEYMLDKMGVSFVGGPTLQKYIIALAKSGAISKEIVTAGQEDTISRDITYGKISNPEDIKNLDYKKYAHELSENPHTPSDVLEKIVVHQKETATKNDMANGEITWTGRNPSYGGRIGEDTKIHFTKAISHANYPLDKLLTLFKKYKDKYKSNPAAINGLIATLWQRPDLPKKIALELVEHVKKYNKKYIPSIPPACFDEEEALSYWKSLPKDRKDSFVDHPNTPNEVLWDALDAKNEKYYTVRHEAYKKLRERGAITDKDVITKAKKELKFDAPDELLKEFGLQAYLGTKGKQKIKFTKVSNADLNKLNAEMKSATTHDDFTFEVVAAYNIDKQVHKDFPATAKKIGNIKHGLYHGTSMSNAAGILAKGITTKEGSRTGAMFGNGFYLASSASKAAQYASDNFSKSGYGVVFKMDAALGKAAEWKYGRPERDSRMKNRDEKTQKALEEYADKEGFDRWADVPRWHLTHDSVWAKKGLALLHDEYVVRSSDQIDIKEIIIVHKEENE